jgi:hypothetical protein
MERNEEVVQKIFDQNKRFHSKFVVVGLKALQSYGWEGNLPTQVFTKFENYWVCAVPSLHSYKIVRIEPWMKNKSEKKIDGNALLPVSGTPKFNLRDLYKKQVQDGDKPKGFKDES